MVRSAHLSKDEILGAIERGEFYASTGVLLKDYQADAKQVQIRVLSHDKSNEVKYRIEFIGKGGRILQDVTATESTYFIKGDEVYVRAKISDSSGKIAWTQPVFVH